MGILSSLYSGISGLAINGNAMSVIGNNIANNNTIGFKTGRSLFSDLLSTTITGSGGTSQVGRGVALSSVDNLFTQGTFENTEQNTDLAIEGDGLFIVRDATLNQENYTRAGAFRFNAEGYLVNPEGYRVQGYALNDAGEITGDLTDIQVDTTSLSSPKMTENVSLATNLDADATYLGGFDINNLANTTNYANSVTIYDSLGNEHLMTIYFSKLDPTNPATPRQWEWHAVVEGSEIGQAPGPYEVGTGGILAFDINGNLDTDPITGYPASQNISAGDFTWNNLSDQSQAITMKFNTTSYSNASIVISQSQDGYTTGSVAQLSIDNKGNVLGNYSNGQPKALYRVALAKFSNTAGLVKVGGSMFKTSTNSGDAIVGTVGSGIGNIFTNALEQSNVDLAKEFVSMITTQRGFQASSKIITTTDEMLSDLINLKR